ncbi:MAG: 3'-5' exonuclease [Sandaracinaceae bacterium]|nr:3'-5' exonuclease [Sandaracinaceae bacterium]
MRASIQVCGCFPTGQYYPGIADRIANAAKEVEGLAPGFDGKTNWVEAPLVVIDFETTGRDPTQDRIIEIGIALFEGATLCEAPRAWLVNPGIPISPESTKITGIDDSMVRDAPNFAQLFPEIVHFLRKRIPVAYNYTVDRSFLLAETSRWKLPAEADVPALDPRCVWIDPLVWARMLQPEAPNHQLSEVCNRFGISIQKAHRANHDAEATGRLLLAMTRDLPQYYGELIRLQKRYASAQDLAALQRLDAKRKGQT